MSLWDRLYREFLYVSAFLWRRVLFRTTFIALTGSAGKTTSKELLANILAREGPTLRTFANANDPWGAPRTLLRVRPWHRYAVIELGAGERGWMLRLGRMVKPDMAIILRVLLVHRNWLRTLEDVAAEKGSLLAALGPGCTAILNGDDPLTTNMTVPAGVRVLRFGTREGLDCRAEEIEAAWPRRLRMRVSMNGESLDIQTRLAGEIWVPSVLAALFAARSLGVTLSAAVREASLTEPYTGRMEPGITPSGAVFIRDDKGSSSATFEASLQVLKSARAKRRILVSSDYSDSSRSHRDRMKHLGRWAASSADMAVFIDSAGETAARSAVRQGMAESAVHWYVNLREASDFLERELRSGDVVLLRGRISQHVARLFFAQMGTVQCWKPLCRRQIQCDLCPDLGAGLEKIQPAGDPPPPLIRRRGNGSTEQHGSWRAV